jgi:hypothetical protein
MCGVCGTNVKKRAAYQVLVGKSEGEKTLGRPNGRGEVIIEIDLQKVGQGCGWV